MLPTEVVEDQSDAHAPSEDESGLYYYGIPSRPALLYRTGKRKWFPPTGAEAYCRPKELREVFDHPLTKVWNNDLGWKVVDVMDGHAVSKLVSVVS